MEYAYAQMKLDSVDTYIFYAPDTGTFSLLHRLPFSQDTKTRFFTPFCLHSQLKASLPIKLV